jgi:Ca2+-binding EF-hand superfamily protein
MFSVDKDELGVMDFEELKNILTQYGEKLDEDDIEIFEQALKVNEGKIIVDGKYFNGELMTVVILD